MRFFERGVGEEEKCLGCKMGILEEGRCRLGEVGVRVVIVLGGRLLSNLLTVVNLMHGTRRSRKGI